MPEELSPSEKRKLFKQRYGELLIPHGFFWKGRNYYRLNIKEQMVLFVSIHYGQSGHMCILRIAAYPFALGLSADHLHEGDIDINGDLLLNRGKEVIRIYPFEEKFEAVYQAFVQNYLEKFLAVHDLASWETFETHAHGGTFWPGFLGTAWPCIILGRFDQAAYYVRNYITSMEQYLDKERKSLAQAEKDAEEFEKEPHTGMHPSTIAANRRSLAYNVQLYRDGINRTIEILENETQYLEKLEPPQTGHFNALIQNAVNQSLETCQTYFGKHAQQ